jgi:hypothetical protein
MLASPALSSDCQFGGSRAGRARCVTTHGSGNDDKYLAKSNKSRMGGEATKKRESSVSLQAKRDDKRRAMQFPGPDSRIDDLKSKYSSFMKSAIRFGCGGKKKQGFVARVFHCRSQRGSQKIHPLSGTGLKGKSPAERRG